MKISLLLAHPNPDSFNHALAEAVRSALATRGVDVTVHDLYAEAFDPSLGAAEILNHESSDPQVEAHAAELVETDGLVIVHPVWFDAPPAILKGWVDRVVREGTAFERPPDGSFRGLLRASASLLITTANAPYEPGTPDALDHFWRTFVLPTSGIETNDRLHLTPVIASDLAMRTAWLEEAARRAETVFLSS